ncbi:MAG: hypothetical protein AAB478_04725 [Patescibacteria group bacterium]
MAKKKTKITKKVAHHSAHRHFRPSYKAHPAWHLTSSALVLILLGIIIFCLIAYYSSLSTVQPY